VALIGIGLSVVIPEVSPSMRFMFNRCDDACRSRTFVGLVRCSGPRASEIAAGGQQAEAAGRALEGRRVSAKKIFVWRSQFRVARRHNVLLSVVKLSGSHDH
jgi:hypothetical protein